MTHIVGIATLDKHVGFGNSKGLLVQLLTKLSDLCIRVNRKELFRQAVEHLTGTHRHIIDSSRHAILLQLLTLWCYQKFGHHIDNVTSRKMCSCLLVIAFRELAYQFFEYVSHVNRTNLVGTHIGLLAAELLDDVVEDAIMVELGDFLVKVKFLDDIHHVL